MLGKRLIIPMVLLTSLLAGCATVAPERVIVPNLASPPPKTITAMERACKVEKDKASCDWIIKLDNHFKKLDSAGKRI